MIKFHEMKCISRQPLRLFHPYLRQEVDKMRKKMALLSLLMLVSVGAVAVASATGALKGLALGSYEVEIDETFIFTTLSPDQEAKAVEIAFGDLQVQEILEGVDDYCTSVSSVYEVKEIERGIEIISKEGLALVGLRIYKDYGEEFGLKVVKVTVDLLKEEAKEIEEYPEVVKPKVHEGIISTDELLGNPSKYHDQVVRVSGAVSDLGLLRGPYFKLDKKLLICYHYDETNIYPTQIKDKIQNGDHVVVTGRFLSDIVYAEKIEKVTS